MKNFLWLFFLALTNLCFGIDELVVVSDRHEFKDADRVSHGQYRRFVSAHHPHHTRDLSAKEWENAQSGKQVALIIHGYNTDYEKAIEYFKDVEEHSQGLYDKMIGYLWPSGDEFWEYYEAEDRIEDDHLPRRLAALLTELSRSAGRVDVIAHSMGCRLFIEALKKKPQSIGNAFLLAPAVDKKTLSSKVLDQVEDLVVFYSHHDEVLSWAYPIVE